MRTLRVPDAKNAALILAPLRQALCIFTISENYRMNDKDNLSTIGEVFESTHYRDINQYLGLGWIIIGVGSDQYAENGYSLRYSVGWPNDLGSPKHPEKLISDSALDSDF